MKGLADHISEPTDTYRVAYIIHFLLGAGNLLPWNAFITAVDYFANLYPNYHIEKLFSVAYMTSSLFVLAIMMVCSSFTEKLSFRLRMNIGFSMFILSLMMAPLLDWTWSTSGSGRSLYGPSVTVASVIMCGLADGLIGGSLVGFAGKLPRQYMQAVFAGSASSGVLVCILRIITKASLPQTSQGLRTSAHFYFIVSSIILLGCIFCSNLLLNLSVMVQHHKVLSLQAQSYSSRPKFWQVAREIQKPAFGVFMIYTITLSIFPGFIAENLKSKLLRDWYPILLITVYNTSDLVGKSLTSIYAMKSISTATWCCIARLLFYPCFAVCLHGPKWLQAEVPTAVLTFVLGLTNGYLTSILMILAPKSVPVDWKCFAGFLSLYPIYYQALMHFWLSFNRAMKGTDQTPNLQAEILTDLSSRSLSEPCRSREVI